MRYENVIILAAGKGTRMARSGLHKGLLPYKGKALIQHIIDRFPDSNICLAVSPDKEGQFREFIAHAYGATERFTFVLVDPDARPFGPAVSLAECLSVVRGPALVTCCDIWWELPCTMPNEKGWLGVARLPEGERIGDFCALHVSEDGYQTLSWVNKARPPSHWDNLIWTGLQYIHDWESALRQINHRIDEAPADEIQCSAGWDDSFLAFPHAYVDLGTADRYQKALAADGFDYSKPDEATYAGGETVIKYFEDTGRVKARWSRWTDLMWPGELGPNQLMRTDHFLSYRKMAGRTMAEVGYPGLLQAIMDHVLTLTIWKRSERHARERFMEACVAFYRGKTETRLANVPAHNRDVWDAALREINWQELSEGAIQVPLHGDLNLDNILIDGIRVRLIDWREDFGGIDHGDLRYDIAKLLSSTRIDFAAIRGGHLRSAGHLPCLPTNTLAVAYEDVLREYCANHGIAWLQIELLCLLIYVGMAGLHLEPFSSLLLAHAGKQYLLLRQRLIAAGLVATGRARDR